jgi:hypothetical protein
LQRFGRRQEARIRSSLNTIRGVRHVRGSEKYSDIEWVEVIPMKTVTSKDVINFIKEHVIHRFEIPQTTTIDRGSVFISEEFKKFTTDVGIKLIRSSPYYAQANGQAEASNLSLIKLSKRKIDEHPRC